MRCDKKNTILDQKNGSKKTASACAPLFFLDFYLRNWFVTKQESHSLRTKTSSRFLRSWSCGNPFSSTTHSLRIKKPSWRMSFDLKTETFPFRNRECFNFFAYMLTSHWRKMAYGLHCAKALPLHRPVLLTKNDDAIMPLIHPAAPISRKTHVKCCFYQPKRKKRTRSGRGGS